jgi:5'-3' exonuclease
MDIKAKTLVIDGKNLIMRGFFAYPLDLAASGLNTNLIHGSLLEVFRHIIEFRPERTIIAWDSPTRSIYRTMVYADYKAGRKKMEAGKFTVFMRQYAVFKEAINALPIIQLESEGIEADDLVAYIAVQDDCSPTVIVSTDRDFWQLVRGTRVVIWEPKKKHLLAGASFAELTRFDSPRHHLAFRCLRGDGDEAPKALRGISDEKAKVIARNLDLPLPGATLKFGWRDGTDMEPNLIKGVWRNYQLVCLHHAAFVQMEQLVKLDMTPPAHRYDDFLKFCQKYKLKNVLESFDAVNKHFVQEARR